jgi:hypothetical protein
MHGNPISFAQLLAVTRSFRQWAMVAVIAFTVVPMHAARSSQLFGRGATEYQPYQNAIHKLTIDYPKKDWQIVSGAGTVVVTFAQKRSEAAVLIEDEALEQPLEAKDITTLFAKLEMERIMGQTPGSANFKSAISGDKDRPLVVVDFTKPSATSGVDRARQYLIVLGQRVYRITCSAQPPLFDKYAPIFEHMVASFKPIQA